MIETLKKVESKMSDPDAILIAWGINPLCFPDERMTKTHLDQVSKTRPIFVFHASGHLATVSSGFLKQEKRTKDSPVAGVAKEADGEPNGELQELTL